MALDALDMLDVIETMENYITSNRPPEEIRDKLDIGYRIDNQSIFLYDTRPDWQDKTIHRNYDFAKTTFDKTKQVWKIYWLRANRKWYSYEPAPKVRRLTDFLQEVSEDKFGCFHG